MKFASLTKNQIIVCRTTEEVKKLLALLNAEGLIWCTGCKYDPAEANIVSVKNQPMGFCPARGTYCQVSYWEGCENLEYIEFSSIFHKPKKIGPKKYKVTLCDSLTSEVFSSMQGVKTFVAEKESAFLLELAGKPIIGGHGKNIFGKPQYVKAFKKRGYKTQA
jgi:hypothetical protein